MKQPISRRSFTVSTMAWAASAHLSTASAADPWPTKPIRLVIPGSSGGGSDLLARALCERLGIALKQPFVIDNKPGASGVIATLAVTGAAPDGYTLLYSNAGSTVMAEALIPKLPFATLRDLTPVALNAVGGVLLIVNPEFPAHTLPELVELVKRSPDRYSYGSPAVGSNGHLTMEWLKQRSGMKATHVAYKTTPSMLTDLVSGVIPMAWLDLSSPLPFIEQGRLRAIAINGNLRNPRLPDLQTMTEQGYPFPATGFQGIFAPAGTPPDIVQRLNVEVNQALSQSGYQAAMRNLNVQPPPKLSPAEFRELVVSNLDIWKRITKEAQIQLDS